MGRNRGRYYCRGAAHCYPSPVRYRASDIAFFGTSLGHEIMDLDGSSQEAPKYVLTIAVVCSRNSSQCPDRVQLVFQWTSNYPHLRPHFCLATTIAAMSCLCEALFPTCNHRISTHSAGIYRVPGNGSSDSWVDGLRVWAGLPFALPSMLDVDDSEFDRLNLVG